MDTNEIIESGILELYVTGALPQDEIVEVETAIANSDELKREVEKIEHSLISLAEAVAPPIPAMVWSYILASISKVKQIGATDHKTTNWSAITGWAAALLAIAGIFWMLNQNNSLQDSITDTEVENEFLQQQVDTTNTRLAETNQVLAVLRTKELKSYTLPGNQAVAPEAYAKAYLDNKANIAYIDAKGLPKAPKGKVYQVWSLIMEPLTPTSMGLLSAAELVSNDVYKFENFPTPEAVGITLEPEGGSETPTLSQLYILGGVTGQ
jgi:anti-sigma-K factor RskA